MLFYMHSGGQSATTVHAELPTQGTLGPLFLAAGLISKDEEQDLGILGSGALQLRDGVQSPAASMLMECNARWQSWRPADVVPGDCA